ncbi:MAG: hypothetical protein IJF03_09785 [Lachnospiraceae bacterium]|nr:hypothetical protein [Lachnospiraceae bacterium]
MKTKYISALVTLTAGAVVAVAGLISKAPTGIFVRNVFITLLISLFLGWIAERIVAKAIAPAPSRDEGEVFENIEEVIRREEEYDEKYNNGKKHKKEVKRIPVGEE